VTQLKVRPVAVVPPSPLRADHDALLAAWERRATLLESFCPRLARGNDRTVRDDMDFADDLATKISELSTSVGVPGCAFF
jgi:hypothetical protein